MRKNIYLLLALVVALCCVFISSCDTEELDHVHNYTERTFLPSCTEDGREEKICTVCDDIILVEVLPAKGHSPNDWQVKVEPTCTVNKVEEKLCKDCGIAVETKVHPVTGHKPGEWQIAIDATCSQNLVEQKVCKVCAAQVESKVGSKLQHDYIPTPISGTCAVGEHVLYTCHYCGDSYKSEFSEPTEAHVEGGWIVEIAPTCSSGGRMKKICSVCSSGLGYEPISMDPDNHSFSVETFPPKDDSEGYTKHTCKLCGFEVINVYESNYLPSQIYEMIASATVRIEGCDKDGKMHNVGSGFFINGKGEIATNYHVIAGARQLKVKLYGGVEYEVISVLGYDIAGDVAVIKIDLEGNSYLSQATNEIKTGDPVYALGSPLGLDDVFTEGVISNPSKLVNGRESILFTAPIASGNSGGPLVNSHGEVVGINTQMAKDGQNLNLALPADKAYSLDISNAKTVYDLYIENLGKNGATVLAYYIMLNYETESLDGDYTINRTLLEESNGAYGRVLRLTYDGDEECVILSINWVSGGRDLYTVEFKLDSVREKYEVRLFDHVWSQYTLEGTLSAKEQVINANGLVDDSVFNKIFSFEYINYEVSGGQSLTQKSAKQLVGMAYIYMLDGFAAELGETNTELTIEHFNFQAPLLKEEPKEE